MIERLNIEEVSQKDVYSGNSFRTKEKDVQKEAIAEKINEMLVLLNRDKTGEGLLFHFCGSKDFFHKDNCHYSTALPEECYACTKNSCKFKKEKILNEK